MSLCSSQPRGSLELSKYDLIFGFGWKFDVSNILHTLPALSTKVDADRIGKLITLHLTAGVAERAMEGTWPDRALSEALSPVAKSKSH